MTSERLFHPMILRPVTILAISVVVFVVALGSVGTSNFPLTTMVGVQHNEQQDDGGEHLHSSGRVGVRRRLQSTDSTPPALSLTMTTPLTINPTAPRSGQQRPVMYTFFNPLLEDAFVTEMSPEGDKALLELWKSTWWEAGWEPRVLTLSDAQNHPEYEAILRQLDSTLLDGYNKLCILRWVAMSQVGGGWMSDYDTFPLLQQQQQQASPATTSSGFAASATNMPLPNNGALTVHDRHVPDLVSGAPSEWIRMARNIVKTLLEKDAQKRQEIAQTEASSPNANKRRRRQYTLWTDMMALQHWAETNPRMFQQSARVLPWPFQNNKSLGTSWTDDDCQRYTPSPGIVAVHFSHAAILQAKNKQTVLRPGQTVNDRADIAKEWLETWRRSCGGKMVATTGESYQQY